MPCLEYSMNSTAAEPQGSFRAVQQKIKSTHQHHRRAPYDIPDALYITNYILRCQAYYVSYDNFDNKAAKDAM